MYSIAPIRLIRRIFVCGAITSILVASFLAGCTNDYANSLPPLSSTPRENPSSNSNATPSTLIDLPSTATGPANSINKITETKLPTLTPTLMPTVTPTPTPTLVPVRVAVPEYLTASLTESIGQAVTPADTWHWQIVPDTEVADIELRPGDDGIPAGQRPVALVVPFILDWHSVSTEDATQIWQNGHPTVTIMDWAEMLPDQRALRVDGLLPHETGYPLTQDWSLVAAKGFEQAGETLANVLRQNSLQEPLVHLAAVGDIMLDRALGYAIDQGNPDYPFLQVTSHLAAADLTVGNLESALGDKGEPALKHYTFQAPPAAAQSLALAGFDIMSLANNHAMDFGPEALIQAIGLLRENGIAAIGAGADISAARTPYFTEINTLRLAVLGYVDVPKEVSGFDTRLWTATHTEPGLAWAEPEVIRADVSAARQEADLVIVVLHSGLEYIEEPSPEQVEAAQAAIESGANLVIGHHAHVLQGVKFSETGVIVYGLGNFAFQIEGQPETAILDVWLSRRGVRQLQFTPVIIQFGGQPRLAESWEAEPIRRRIYQLTSILNPR